MLRIECQAVLAANKPLHLMIKLRYSRCANVYSSRLASNAEVSHQILPFADSTSCPLQVSVNGCDNAQTRTHITLLNVSHSLESETSQYPRLPQKPSARLSSPTKSMDSEQIRQPYCTSSKRLEGRLPRAGLAGKRWGTTRVPGDSTCQPGLANRVVVDNYLDY